jgi:hypothetical protein
MTDAARTNPLVELLINIVIPSVILVKWSGPQDLGATNALLLALAFPLTRGALDLARPACAGRRRRLNLFAALGLFGILLTGGIGLLQLDAQWLAVKEAAIPGVLGLVVAGSALTRYPLARVLLYNPAILDVEKIDAALAARGNAARFEARLRAATWMLGGAFFFSSVMNYWLATWIVTSPAGGAAFNEELGRLTFLSYPMIALPATLMTLAALLYLARGVRRLAGIGLGEALRS